MYCNRCGGTLKETEFYLSKNKEKYPLGRIDVCKKCLTAHLDNFNPDTYLWILEDLDVPYVPDEWNSLIDKFSGGDPSKLKKTSILGRYLSKMQLTQYCEYKWKDTAHLQEKKEKRVAEAMKLRGFSQAEIDEVIEKGAIQIPDHPKELALMTQIQPSDGLPSQRTGVSYADDPLAVRKSPEDYFEEQSNIKEGQLVGELTPEDEKYLLLKWGKTYRPYEWVKLEDLYQKMYESYDIQGAGHEDTLILVCKTSLKANQLLDIGDRRILCSH